MMDFYIFYFFGFSIRNQSLDLTEYAQAATKNVASTTTPPTPSHTYTAPAPSVRPRPAAGFGVAG